MELSSSIIMEAFLIFPEMEAPKKNPYISAKGTFLYFRKQKLLKNSYISESNFLRSIKKKKKI